MANARRTACTPPLGRHRYALYIELLCLAISSIEPTFYELIKQWFFPFFVGHSLNSRHMITDPLIDMQSLLWHTIICEPLNGVRRIHWEKAPTAKAHCSHFVLIPEHLFISLISYRLKRS